LERYLLIVGTGEFSGAGKITKYFKSFISTKKINILSLLYIKNAHQKKFFNDKYLQAAKFYKFFYFFKIIFTIIKRNNQIKAIYLQENAGLGKIYDILLMFICNFYKKNCFYHNHSSGKYIKYDLLSKIIQKISNYRIRHIFLNKKEGRNFIEKYGKLKKYYYISNSIFIKDIKSCQERNNLSKNLSFGLLSNLTEEKGLDKFLNFAKYSFLNKKSWKFYLAGPIMRKKKYYLEIISKLPNLKYLGSIYSEKSKSKFYKKVDFFLFLSSYLHESEPLVLLEAISHGTIPIVFNRGSISDLVFSKELIIDNNSNYLLSINNLVEDFIRNNQLKNLSLNSFKKFLKIRKKSQSQFNKLIKELKSLN